jgi:hypothetical protein
LPCGPHLDLAHTSPRHGSPFLLESARARYGAGGQVQIQAAVRIQLEPLQQCAAQQTVEAMLELAQPVVR